MTLFHVGWREAQGGTKPRHYGLVPDQSHRVPVSIVTYSYITGPMDDSSADNTELTAIFDELDPLYENRELDAFCLYL